ncbi:TPA: hypothetical protein ACF2XL_004734 [Escherichia coli]|nr:hypothetical protein [Escherichia coli]
MTTTTTETAKEVLRGYGRANEAALASLMDVQDWQRIARQELERRAAERRAAPTWRWVRREQPRSTGR